MEKYNRKISLFRWYLCGNEIRDLINELNKRALLAEKEREDLRKNKNNAIIHQKKELDSKDIMLKTKDNLLKQRDKNIHELTEQINDYKVKVADLDMKIKDLQNDGYEKDETIKTLKEKLEIALKKIAFCKSHSRLPNTEELKAYTFGRKEVLKRMKRSNNGNMETNTN